ncbi:MAG: OpgC domain-containing protein [Paracoccaceae bacterium]
MSAITISDQTLIRATATTANPAKVTGSRDIRLDFFRGIAMFIILAAHIPSDWLALWIPARFGFSDATEMFVFCSGMASAIAFGAVFRERGWLMGTARVAFRLWQLYWAHIGLFVAVAAASAVLFASGWFEIDHVGQMNLYPFFDDPLVHLPALLTLTYVPNYFDILPMYIVVLAMLPLVIALARLHLWVAVAFVIGLWVMASVFGVNLPAEPLSDRPWFFNPFGWQLVFFTGFGFASGWLKVPPVDRRLIQLAIVVVVVSVPFAYFRVINAVPEIQEWRKANVVLIDKTNFGLFRYVHFLALAYLALCLVGPKGARLLASPANPTWARLWHQTRTVIMTVGQQSLAVFVFSMFIAVLLGAVLDAVGRSAVSMIWVNALGFAMISAAAYGAAWFKKKSWVIKGAKA